MIIIVIEIFKKIRRNEDEIQWKTFYFEMNLFLSLNLIIFECIF